MFKVELWGGYFGDCGTITARKTIELPFVPVKDLLLDTDIGLLVIIDDEIRWDTRSNQFTAHVSDFGGGSDETAQLSEWIERLKEDGWEIVESDESK